MNEDIKAYAKIHKVKLWLVADALGITDTQFSRKLRYELDAEFKSKVLKIIDQLAVSKTA